MIRVCPADFLSTLEGIRIDPSRAWTIATTVVGVLGGINFYVQVLGSVAGQAGAVSKVNSRRASVLEEELKAREI